jgi:hypothetical protein
MEPTKVRPQAGESTPGPDSRPERDLREQIRVLESALAFERIERQDASERAQKAYQLFAAVARLHESGSAVEVCAAVEEIIYALLGCRDLAIYLLAEDGDFLRRVFAAGSSPRPATAPPSRLGEGPEGRAIAQRRAVVELEVDLEHLTIAVPLGTDRKVTGALVLYRFDAARAVLGHPDRALVEILGRHIGLALSLR